MQQSLGPLLVAAALLLTCATRIASPDPTIGLSITKNKFRLTIQGSVSSTAHAAILRQTAAKYFPGHDLEIDVQQDSSMPHGWSLVTDTTLRALANTHSSSAFVDEQHIRISGVVTDAAAWLKSVDRINKSLLNGMQLQLNVVPIEKSAQFDRLCENLFAQVLQKGSVEFAKSNAELGTSSLSLLDEIVEIATDCPSLSISVTGHTDDTGNESANTGLSKARAQSVITYLIERGIEPKRLTAIGAGSATPIASNEDAAGRKVNRRIDFEMGIP